MLRKTFLHGRSSHTLKRVEPIPAKSIGGSVDTTKMSWHSFSSQKDSIIFCGVSASTIYSTAYSKPPLVSCLPGYAPPPSGLEVNVTPLVERSIAGINRGKERWILCARAIAPRQASAFHLSITIRRQTEGIVIVGGPAQAARRPSAVACVDLYYLSEYVRNLCRQCAERARREKLWLHQSVRGWSARDTDATVETTNFLDAQRPGCQHG